MQTINVRIVVRGGTPGTWQRLKWHTSALKYIAALGCYLGFNEQTVLEKV